MIANKTTTHLKLPRRWYDVSPPAGVAICVLALLMIAALVGRVQSEPGAVVASPTPALPVIVIQKETQPTAVPVQPTPDQQVYAELAALRARVAELEAQPAPQPAVVYVEAAPVVEMAAPTPEPGAYAVTNEPPADFYAPPNVPIEERQKLIGTDPHALACGGSPLCGGLTNAEAQAALDAERAAQR